MKKKNYWLMKSEPSCYGIDDLKKEGKTAWSGVRNYQARNFMRDMQVGDGVLIYHSNCKEPAVVGIGKVSKEAFPDKTQFDPKDDHYDPNATKEKPIWDNVEVSYVKTLKHPVTLLEIKFNSKLNGMIVAQKGSRLSVLPVEEKHYALIEKMGK